MGPESVEKDMSFYDSLIGIVKDERPDVVHVILFSKLINSFKMSIHGRKLMTRDIGSVSVVCTLQGTVIETRSRER